MNTYFFCKYLIFLDIIENKQRIDFIYKTYNCTEFYLAMLNIPQICLRYAISIVPVANIAVAPMHKAASLCKRIK